LDRAVVIGIGSEPQHAAAAALRRFKAKDGFDRIGAGAPHVAGRSAMQVYLETGRTRAAGMRCKLAHNRIRVADRLDVPGQGEQITPMAVSMKQPLEARAARRCECCFELRQPTLRNRRHGVCSGQHWRYPGWLRGTVGSGLKLAYPPKAAPDPTSRILLPSPFARSRRRRWLPFPPLARLTQKQAHLPSARPSRGGVIGASRRQPKQYRPSIYLRTQ